jgi:hypothetical protein
MPRRSKGARLQLKAARREKIAMREPTGERKAHVSGAVSGAVIPLLRNNTQ